jgi:exodeoxyribonuclease V beta subunit
LLRAALVTRLWGLSWPALDALLVNEAAWDAQVEQFIRWQRIWRTQGVLPMLHRLLHDQALARRLLAQGAPGERALTNVLHLGELLQAASSTLQGEGALLRHFEAQLRRPAASADVAQLRLESDAHLVQVVTLHKSKGLEYPLVFLPFLSNYRAEDSTSTRPDAERLAEDIRLLYVALTRAQRALWLGVAQTRGDVDGKNPLPKSALSVLLGRSAPDDLAERLQLWGSEHIAVQMAPAPDAAIYQPVIAPSAAKGARLAQRVLRRNWWSASFSALTRDLDAGTTQTGNERDELVRDAQLDSAVAAPTFAESAPATLLVPAELAFNAFPAGSSYGTLLHDLLQWQAEQGWPAHRDALERSSAGLEPGDIAPDPRQTAWQMQLMRACQRLGLDEGQRTLLDTWVTAIFMTNLSVVHVQKALLAINLGSLKSCEYWPEMGFTLPVQRLESGWLDHKVSQAAWPGLPRAALQDRSLQGLLTGFMDLVLQVQGRYYVLDYKSNRLPDYTPGTLTQAMLDHRYDVQAVLYVLALHRLLKSRQPSYDYDQHMGGALYWFVRGVDQPGTGLLQWQAPRALIEELDSALSHPLPAGGTP